MVLGSLSMMAALIDRPPAGGARAKRRVAHALANAQTDGIFGER